MLVHSAENATVEYRNYNPSRASVMNDPRVQQTMGAWGGGSCQLTGPTPTKDSA